MTPHSFSTAQADISWTSGRQGWSCTHCGHSFLVASSQKCTQCPLCTHTSLSTWFPEAESEYALFPPEGLTRPEVHAAQLQEVFASFIQKVPLPPDDLKVEQLMTRLQLVYLPQWWVDVPVQADWQGEMGFDYQVVSHEESLKGQQWVTTEKRLTRTRWEVRKGRLKRHYDNVPAPALENWRLIEEELGKFIQMQAAAYSQEGLGSGILVLPQRPPEDAWGDAYLTVRSNGGRECQEASGAQHHRGFYWLGEIKASNWTQHLLPLYTSWYQDDEGQVHPIYVHGTSGECVGSRQGSLAKAKKQSALLGGFAVVLLTIAGLLLWEYLPASEPVQQFVGKGAAFVGIVLGIWAAIRPSSIRKFNERNWMLPLFRKEVAG